MSASTLPGPPILGRLLIPSSTDPDSQAPLPLSPSLVYSPRSTTGPTSPLRGRTLSSGPNFLFPPPASTHSHSCNSQNRSPNYSRPTFTSPPNDGPTRSTEAEMPPQTSPALLSSSSAKLPGCSSASALPISNLQANSTASHPSVRPSKNILQRLPTFLRRSTKRSLPSSPNPPALTSLQNKRASRVFDLPALRSPTCQTSDKTYVSPREHRLLAQSLLGVGGGLGLSVEGAAPGGAARMEGWRRSVVPPAGLVVDGWSLDEKAEEERVEFVVGDEQTDARGMQGWVYPTTPTKDMSPAPPGEIARPSAYSGSQVYGRHRHVREFSSSTPNLHQDVGSSVDTVTRAKRPTSVSLTRHTNTPPHTDPIMSFKPSSPSSPSSPHEVAPRTPPHTAPARQPTFPSVPSLSPPPSNEGVSSPASRSKLRRLTTFFDSPSKRRPAEVRPSERRQGLGERLVVHSPEAISRKIREMEDEDGDGEGRKRMESFFM